MYDKTYQVTKSLCRYPTRTHLPTYRGLPYLYVRVFPTAMLGCSYLYVGVYPPRPIVHVKDNYKYCFGFVIRLLVETKRVVEPNFRRTTCVSRTDGVV